MAKQKGEHVSLSTESQKQWSSGACWEVYRWDNDHIYMQREIKTRRDRQRHGETDRRQ